MKRYMPYVKATVIVSAIVLLAACGTGPSPVE